MDPTIANQDLDPPPPPSLLRRGLVPALLVNVAFLVALAWSVPWERPWSSAPAANTGNDLRTMGAAPAAAPDRPPEAPAPAAAPAAPAPDTQHAALSPRPTQPARAPTSAAADAEKPRPSFDCAKARSRTEKLICADPELAELDRDLGRLNVRARTYSSDPVAFRKAGDAEWKRREAECRDKACLLAWYEHRRRQLLQAIAGGDRDTGG